jgi:TonB family protein
MFNPGGREIAAPSLAPRIFSAALHLCAGMCVVYLTTVDSSPARPLFRSPKTSLVYIPAIPIEIPTIKLAELRAPVPVKVDEPAPLRPIEQPAPIFESRRAEVAKAVELPIEPAPTRPPPAPRKPEVTVGTFASATEPPRVPEPVRQVEIAGFDRAANKPVEVKPATTVVGAFDRASNGPGSQPSPKTVIADAGFNRSNVVASSAPEGRVIRETGFGNSNSREKPKVAEPPAELVPAGFDRAKAPQSAAGAPPPPAARQIIPVEVLSKPTPIYTDEARKLRIEGDVLLHVEFSASGTLRVVRVVRGLGHGLDEAAIQAAQQIRFKPALDHGRAVDSSATVTIVFRLA